MVGKQVTSEVYAESFREVSIYSLNDDLDGRLPVQNGSAEQDNRYQERKERDQNVGRDGKRVDVHFGLEEKSKRRTHACPDASG